MDLAQTSVNNTVYYGTVLPFFKHSFIQSGSWGTWRLFQQSDERQLYTLVRSPVQRPHIHSHTHKLPFPINQRWTSLDSEKPLEFLDRTNADWGNIQTGPRKAPSWWEVTLRHQIPWVIFLYRPGSLYSRASLIATCSLQSYWGVMMPWCYSMSIKKESAEKGLCCRDLLQSLCTKMLSLAFSSKHCFQGNSQKSWLWI